MRITTLKKNETDIRLLVQRLYPNLEVGMRTKAEKAMVKANPHLKKAGAFRSGIIVSIPAIQGITVKPAAKSDDPVEEVQDLLLGAVKEFNEKTERSMSQALEDIERQMEVLDNEEVAPVIKKQEKTRAIAEQLTESLVRRKEVVKEEQEAQNELFQKIYKDLKAMPAW